MNTRRCSHCSRDLPVAQFHRKGAGHDHRCKACKNAYRRGPGREMARARFALKDAIRRGAVVAQRVMPSTVYASTGGLCGICCRPVSADAFDLDHIIPVARGGYHVPGNLQPAHPACNNWKRDRMPAHARAA